MAVVWAVACVHIVVSLFSLRSLGLTAFGDVLQCVLLVCATLATLSNIRSSDKKIQLFWTLMALGCAMWLCAQLMWTYFEVLLRQEAPNPFVGDVILFLHIVPMIAAVAIEPDVDQDKSTIRAGTVDFALLFTWWMFLYFFVVIPWQ